MPQLCLFLPQTGKERGGWSIHTRWSCLRRRMTFKSSDPWERVLAVVMDTSHIERTRPRSHNRSDFFTLTFAQSVNIMLFSQLLWKQSSLLQFSTSREVLHKECAALTQAIYLQKVMFLSAKLKLSLGFRCPATTHPCVQIKPFKKGKWRWNLWRAKLTSSFWWTRLLPKSLSSSCFYWQTSAVELSSAHLHVNLRSICFPTRFALQCGTKNRELSTAALKKQQFALRAD